MKIFEVNEKCKSCKGTGLYVGMAERDGAAVVCSTCKGTGCHKFRHEYEDFSERKVRADVVHVLQCNPGICVGGSGDVRLEDFGGLPIEDWMKGASFALGTEMRKYTCPAWWYQCADYSLKPRWEKCIGVDSFSSCRYFREKSSCWERFDKEHNRKS